MQIAAPTTRPDTSAATHNSASRTPLLLRLLNWIADADARYRQKQKLKSLPDERLADMGMTRRDVDLAFSQHGPMQSREQ